MKLYLPLLSLVIVLASCSTSYKSGQTPDDVYFSPERQREQNRDEYVRVEQKDDRQYSSEESREDRYLRMKTSYRRYSVLDDFDCYSYGGNNYNRYYDYYRNNNYYGYNNNMYWNTWNSYNPYYYNPYYNKPYYTGYVAGNIVHVYNKPRKGALYTYGNNGNNPNGNAPKGNGRTFSNGSSNNDNYRGSGTTGGGFLRNVFGGSNNSSSGSSTNSSSSSNNNSSSSSSSSSGKSGGSAGSSGSAPVRKF